MFEEKSLIMSKSPEKSLALDKQLGEDRNHFMNIVPDRRCITFPPLLNLNAEGVQVGIP